VTREELLARRTAREKIMLRLASGADVYGESRNPKSACDIGE
jgi:hypothetical protein